MTRKRLLGIIVGLILLIIMFGSLYISGMRSDAYTTSIGFISSSEAFKESIGELETSRLALLGYAIRYHGPNGDADYKICVTAKKGKGAVYLHLQKDTGVWSVIKANLVLENGATVKLL